MNRFDSPGCAASRTIATKGSVRSFFSTAVRCVALLRLSILPTLAVVVLTTVAQAAQFTLTWTDNSTNETGFRIERSTDAVTFAEIATVGANVVSYVDAGLPNSTSYSYRLRAYNSAGNSGYSNVATGTTPPPASNNAPTITDIANQTINAGSTTGAIAFTVGDVETAVASLTLSRSSSNTTLVPTANVVLGGSGSSRTVTVTPAAGQSGTATITVTVSDGSLTASDTFVVTVNAVNSAPTITDIANRTINEDANTGAVSFTIGDAQTAAGSLTVTTASSNTTLVPSAAIVLGGSGSARTVTVTPAANQSGTATITITVSDGSLTASDSFVLTVSAVNDAPTISNVTDRSINQDTITGAIAFTVGDVETAVASLTVSGSSSNTTLVPAANVVFGGSGSNRTVTVTPAAGQSGTATITVTVSDGSLTASDTFVVTVNAVNSAPTITDIADRTINEDANTGAVSFTIGDAQTAAGSLTVTTASSNTTLVPSAAIVLGGSGSARTVTVTPAANQSGTATITITVSDGSLTASDSFVLTVSAVNDAPTISNVTDRSINQDTNTGAIAFTVGDVETAVASLTVSGNSSNTTLVPTANVVLGGSGSSRTVTVTPAAGQSGTATITITVSDGSLTASDTFVVTVNAVNSAPTITDIANRTINEDANTGAVSFTIGDAQTAAGSLTVTTASSNTTLVPSAAIVLGGSGSARTVTVTPAANQSGTATITITVSDGSLTASDSFVLTVSAVNDAPTISGIADRSINQDTDTGAIGFTVGDAETAASSLSLSASSSNITLVPHASIAFGGSGTSRTVSVTPAAGQSGVATITVTVSDGTSTASDSFVLTVISTNTAPVITSQPAAATVVAGGSVSFAVVATGNPTPTYQWRFNGAAIVGATAASYTISPVQSSHAGTYSVVVGNMAGSVTSYGAALSVTDALSIIGQPASQSIAKGAKATLTVTAAGTGLAYQWYAGLSGDVTSPISGATSAAYTTSKLSTTTSYWVRVSAGSQSVNSATATITVVDTQRTGSGSIRKGNRGIQAAPILTANAVTDGTFAVMIAQDDTLQMLAIDTASGLLIDAGGVTLDDAGGFSFAADGVGTVSGQVAGNIITGSVVGTDITFDGTIDPVDGSTSALVGWFNGVIVNSSNGEVLVLAGPDGRAFVLTYVQGSVSGGLVIMDTTGAIAVTLPDGRSLALTINGASGRLTGTTVASGKSDKVSGNRAGDVLEKRLANTSVRAQVRQGDALIVAGFVVEGSGNKRVLIRAVGPTLAGFGVTGVLADPVVTLFRQGSTASLAQNDNWGTASNAADVASVATAVGAFALPVGSKDAVILTDLPTGAYTAQVTGVNGATGMAIVEVYDADAVAGASSIPTQLANISMRGIAGNDDDLVIAGFVVTGNAPKQVLIRAVGPELAAWGVGGVAGDPMLNIFSRVEGKEVQIATNNDWGVDAAAVSAAGDHVGAFKLASGSKSSAMVIWLEPGVYTAQASSNTGSSGVALVEVYEVQ